MDMVHPNAVKIRIFPKPRQLHDFARVIGRGPKMFGITNCQLSQVAKQKNNRAMLDMCNQIWFSRLDRYLFMATYLALNFSWRSVVAHKSVWWVHWEKVGQKEAGFQ